MARLFRKLSEPYDFGWTLRDVKNADVTETKLGDGRLEIRIDHAPLEGVTTEMLEWWFQNFDGTAQFRGERMPAYHLWHPFDHVAVAFHRDASSRVAAGQRLHIQEVFGRDRRFETDATAVIHRWDKRGIGFHKDVLGHRIMELDHVFTDAEGGTLYRTCMRVGAGNGPLRRFINGYLVPRLFGANKTKAWIRHNVEEVGCFSDFLPELFATRVIEHVGRPLSEKRM